MDAKGTSPVLLNNYSPTAAEGWTASPIRDVCRISSGLRFPKEANWSESPPKLNIHLFNKDPNLVFCSCIYLLVATKQTQSHENARTKELPLSFLLPARLHADQVHTKITGVGLLMSQEGSVTEIHLSCCKNNRCYRCSQRPWKFLFLPETVGICLTRDLLM